VNHLSVQPSRRFDVVFCDVDGCLMPEVEQVPEFQSLAFVSDFNRQAMERCDRPVIIPCTGRPQPYAEAVCRLLGCPLAICEQGVWIYDYLAHRWTMDPAIQPEDIQIVRTFERWVETELGPHGCFLQLGKAAAVTIFHDNVEWLFENVKPQVEQLVVENNWPLRVSNTWSCINVDLAKVSKASAIDRLVHAHRLDPARLAGIGDTMGDLAIRNRVAWFGCPSNADDQLKTHADRLATAPLAQGVVELLQALI